LNSTEKCKDLRGEKRLNEKAWTRGWELRGNAVADQGIGEEGGDPG